MSLITRLHNVLENSPKDQYVEIRTSTSMEELRRLANLENIPLERLKLVERLVDGEFGLLDMEENIFYKNARDPERGFSTYGGTIMVFEDPEVKSYLVKNIGGESGITNNYYGVPGVKGVAGEVTYEQVLACKRVDFASNKKVRRFNELEYFRNLETLRFDGCSELEELSLPYMSLGGYANWIIFCSKLRKITTRYGLDVVGSSILRGNSKLSELDISKWNLGNLSNGDSMFSGCSSLKTLDTSKWNLEKVTDLGSTFDGCRRLTELNSSSWNLIRCSYYKRTFNRCNTLVKIDLTYSKTPISIVNNQDDVLNDCINLESIVGDHNETDDVSVFNGYNSGEFNCMYYRKNLNLASILAAIRGVGTNNNKRKFKLPIGFDKSRIPQEYKIMLENKNWELA